MWHELALNLGGTVGELQRRMSHAEFTRWLTYRRAHGPLTDERRFDRPAALLAWLYSSVHAAKGRAPGSLAEFMPWSDEPSATIDDVARELGF